MLDSGSGAGKAKPPAFVEFLATDATAKPEYTIELQGGQSTLRVRCVGTAMAEVVQLCRTLWDVAR